jgi:L-malate glycosyltransferase
MKPRILILADIHSPHTQKWAKDLSNSNFKIGLFSFNHTNLDWLDRYPNIQCLYQAKSKQNNSFIGKLKYLLLWPRLIYAILQFKPNAVHAHYASSYGLLAALTFFKPLIVSIWGSDLTEFPHKNKYNGLILRYIFWRASKICVTSSILETELKNYSSKKCVIIPFGINLNTFYKNTFKHTDSGFTFGCIKHFEKVYNIENVIEAFSILLRKYPSRHLKLKLVGDGSLMPDIIHLIHKLDISEQVELPGYISHDLIPIELNSMDVLVNVSEYESFGVSVAEAMACQIPVIVSKAEGFKDLVPNSKYAVITDSTTSLDIFKAMEQSFLNVQLRKDTVQNSYQLITEKFDWSVNLKQMKQVYQELMHVNIS